MNLPTDVKVEKVETGDHKAPIEYRFETTTRWGPFKCKLRVSPVLTEEMATEVLGEHLRAFMECEGDSQRAVGSVIDLDLGSRVTERFRYVRAIMFGGPRDGELCPYDRDNPEPQVGSGRDVYLLRWRPVAADFCKACLWPFYVHTDHIGHFDSTTTLLA